MYDVVTVYLNDEAIRCVSMWTLSFAALIIFFFAFAVTDGAGVHSPLAITKALQRFFYCALSIACAYAAACIAYFGWTPPGPILILFVAFGISTTLSAIRHISGPVLAEHDTWRAIWQALDRWHGGRFLRKVLPAHGSTTIVDHMR